MLLNRFDRLVSDPHQRAAARRREEVRSKKLIPLTDPPGDEYRTNIQIAELNALNASLAMLCFKQHCGFYAQAQPAYHLLMNTALLKLFVEPTG